MCRHKDSTTRKSVFIVLMIFVILNVSAIVVTPFSLAIAEIPKEWVCKAEGIYIKCENSRSWIPCQEFRSRGIGIAKDRLEAIIEAESSCADNMSEMMVIESKSGRPSMKMPCSMIICELQ